MVTGSTATPLAETMPGGPPSIRIAEKPQGDITRAEWTATTAIKLAGCVADARVTGMTVCINNCTGKQEMLQSTSATLTPAMKSMITNLPDGTPFTVKVVVKDAAGKPWDVPEAAFKLVR